MNSSTPLPSQWTEGVFFIGDDLAMEPDNWLDQLLASGTLVEIPKGRLVDREAINYEAVAAVEHDQWTRWSMALVQTEDISDERVARWTRLWNTEYTDLTESEKESDREWASKAIATMLDASDG